MKNTGHWTPEIMKMKRRYLNQLHGPRVERRFLSKMDRETEMKSIIERDMVDNKGTHVKRWSAFALARRPYYQPIRQRGVKSYDVVRVTHFSCGVRHQHPYEEQIWVVPHSKKPCDYSALPWEVRLQIQSDDFTDINIPDSKPSDQIAVVGVKVGVDLPYQEAVDLRTALFVMIR